MNKGGNFHFVLLSVAIFGVVSLSLLSFRVSAQNMINHTPASSTCTSQINGGKSNSSANQCIVIADMYIIEAIKAIQENNTLEAKDHLSLAQDLLGMIPTEQ